MEPKVVERMSQMTLEHEFALEFVFSPVWTAVQ